MWLVERVGRQPGRALRVSGERWLVGRSEDCELTISDANVSRWHAYLTESADGAVELHDLGSQNGSWVDGRRVAHAVLRGGEQLQFGDTVLLTSLSEPRAEAGTAVGEAALTPAGTGDASSSLIRRALRADSVFQRALRDQSTLQRSVRTSGRRAIAAAAALAGVIVGRGAAAHRGALAGRRRRPRRGASRARHRAHRGAGRDGSARRHRQRLGARRRVGPRRHQRPCRQRRRRIPGRGRRQAP